MYLLDGSYLILELVLTYSKQRVIVPVMISWLNFTQPQCNLSQRYLVVQMLCGVFS